MSLRKHRTISRVHLADAAACAGGISRPQALHVVEDFLSLIADELVGGKPVMLTGFGKFLIVDRAERRGRNVHAGHEMIVGRNRAVRFKPASRMMNFLCEGLCRASVTGENALNSEFTEDGTEPCPRTP